MQKDETVSIIRKHRAELELLGARHIALFGSVARGTESARSDVDVVVQLDDSIRGFKRIASLDDLQNRLSQILACPVDVIEDQPRSEAVRKAIQRDAIRAF